MGWASKGRQQATPSTPPTPVGPPDPEAVRRQLAAERVAAATAWQVFIRQQVLPGVNAALRSTEFASYKAGYLSINGSRTRARVYEVTGMTDWIAPLLQALREPPYASYAIKLKGTYQTGAHYRSARPHHVDVELNSQDISRSTEEFRRRHAGGYFSVEISL